MEAFRAFLVLFVSVRTYNTSCPAAALVAGCFTKMLDCSFLLPMVIYEEACILCYAGRKYVCVLWLQREGNHNGHKAMYGEAMSYKERLL
jgi:hypothetical protein